MAKTIQEHAQHSTDSNDLLQSLFVSSPPEGNKERPSDKSALLALRSKAKVAVDEAQGITDEDDSDDEDSVNSLFVETDDATDESESDDTDEGDNATVDDDETDADADTDDSDEDDSGYLDVTDDDLIEVKVDGKVKTVTLGDLKKAYSATDAVESRLQEATETRKKAQTDHSMLLTNFIKSQDAVTSTVSALEAAIIRPMVNEPDERIRLSNPNEYLKQVDAYRADQHRMGTLKTKLAAFYKQHEDIRAAEVDKFRTAQIPKLVEAFPVLKDPVKGPELLGALQATARYYGFADAEIGDALDYRYYQMAYDAMMYRKLSGKRTLSVEQVKNVADQEKKAIRKLRSGNTRGTVNNTAAKKAADAQRAKAMASGKERDILPTLFVPRK